MVVWKRRKTPGSFVPYRHRHSTTDRASGPSKVLGGDPLLRSRSSPPSICSTRRSLNDCCVDQMLIALTTTILSTLTPTPAAHKHRVSTGKRDLDVPPLEMIAMRLAKELLVCSSRTDGSGDILDALHLVFPSNSFSIYPRAKEMEAITVSLSTESSFSSSSVSSCSDSATPLAEITIAMRYWVIPSVHEERDVDQQHRNDEVLGVEKKGHDLQLPQTLVGDFYNWHEVQGRVRIDFLR